MLAHIPDYITKIDALLGGTTYLVGGCVRDMFLGRVPHDYDIASPLEPFAVLQAIGDKYVNPIGLEYGTVQIVLPGCPPVEHTTFRADGTYGDGRRPDCVTFSTAIEEDLARRDFTMNAMALRVSTGELIDPFHGQDDIAWRRIRFVGDPDARIGEDALRLLRGLRFASQLGFEVDARAQRAMCCHAHLLDRISSERIWAEWKKICLGKEPMRALELMDTLQVIDEIFTELIACRGLEQNDWHHLPVFDHCLETFYFVVRILHHPETFFGDIAQEFMPANDARRVLLLTAALIHDIGKGVSRFMGKDGRYHFYEHEFIGADLTKDIAARLRMSSDEADGLFLLVQEHMRFHHIQYGHTASRKQMRHLLDAARPYWRELALLTIADTMAARGPRADVEAEQRELLAIYQQVAEYERTLYAPVVENPLITGKHLLAIGMAPGRMMGSVLGQLTKMFKEGILCTFEEGIAWVRETHGTLLTKESMLP